MFHKILVTLDTSPSHRSVLHNASCSVLTIEHPVSANETENERAELFVKEHH